VRFHELCCPPSIFSHNTQLASTYKPSQKQIPTEEKYKQRKQNKINMNFKTSLLALIALPSLEACRFSHLGGDNPHAAAEQPEDQRMLLQEAREEPLDTKHFADRKLLFVGNAAEAIEAARAEILDIMETEPRLGPKFVRLGFHDCVGGCDGCVDMANSDNAGLDPPITALSSTVSFYQEQLTRADVWALAALSAAEAMQGNAPGSMPYNLEYYGRESCSDERGGPDVTMPSNHILTEDLLEFFHDEFDFNPTDTVAIMGVHTL
jgi:hypothetical protein